MKQLSQVFENIKHSSAPWERSSDISDTPQHGSTSGDGMTNTQLSKVQSQQAPMTTSAEGFPLPLLKLLSNQEVDWDGVCNFEDGKVVSFKYDLPSNHRQMRPIPQSDKAKQDAKIALSVLEGLMKPATSDQIAIAVKRLSLHCGMQAKAPEDVKSMFLDYCHDLKKYPIKLLEDACAKYRTMPEGNQFMPNSGQLMALMHEKYTKMLFMKIRIDKILGTYVSPEPKQNRVLSLDEALDRLM